MGSGADSVPAAPFIVTFWVIWFIADARPELIKLGFGPWPVEDVKKWGGAVIVDALGTTAVRTDRDRGVLLPGVLVSNWRHAVIALVAAFIAVTRSPIDHVTAGGRSTHRVRRPTPSRGARCRRRAGRRPAAGHSRGPAGNVVSSAYINRNAPVPALASGLCIAVWTVMFLGGCTGASGPRPATPPATRDVRPPSEIEPFGHLGLVRPASVGWRIGRRMLSACAGCDLDETR